MSIFDFFSADDTTVNCVHCGKSFTTKRPKPLKKNVYETAQWHLENLSEELHSVYIYENSQVIFNICPHCKGSNYLYLDSNHKLLVSDKKPKDTYLTKELLEHWVEKK